MGTWWIFSPVSIGGRPTLTTNLSDNGAYCLAKPGEIYAVYLPKGGKVTVKLEPGTYTAMWFSALTGEKIALPTVQGPSWTSPKVPDQNDWALLLQKKR